jgi:RNA polymerase sigma factor (TIGR02999 family)
MEGVTLLLKRIGEGDNKARDELYALLYDDLRRLAHSRVRRSETITLLDTTSLVHDTYLKLVNAHQLRFEDRGKFFAYAASLMRAIVVDAVRARRAGSRGGGAVHLILDTQIGDAAPRADEEVIKVHDALDDLRKLDERLVNVVEMRYFAGLTEQEIAEALGVTERTVRRDWEKARAILFGVLQ